MNVELQEKLDVKLPEQASIPVAQIDAEQRLRAIDADWVAMIAASMQEEGQRTPIEVRKAGRRYKLIAGGHRLEALKLAGIEAAWCVVKKVSDEEAMLLEIDENLCRRELSELDRATFLARRKEVYESLYPETANGGDRRSDQNDKLVVLIQSFSQATAEKLGFSKRTIERSVARYKHIQPDVREQISGTWLAASGAQLDALAKETPDMQREIADAVLQWPNLRSVADIVRQLKNQPKKAPPSMLEKLMGLWNKADSATRMRFQDYIAPGLPLDDGREAA